MFGQVGCDEWPRGDRGAVLYDVQDDVAGAVVRGHKEEVGHQAGPDSLVDDYFLLPSPDYRANVVLHVMDHRIDAVSWSVLAADLAEYGGSRENARVAELIRENV